MDSKKSPKGRKRTAKTNTGATTSGAAGEDHFWDCSVCTFRNNAEAFKCSMCDVRKGTSTRKPRLNPDLVAQQQAQALTPPPALGPPIPSSSGVKSPAPSPGSAASGDVGDEDETDLAALASLKANKRVAKDKLKKKEPKKTVGKARLKNVDRSSATYHSVTVNDFTVVITEFKPKAKKEKKEKPDSNGRSPSHEDDDSNSDSKHGGLGPTQFKPDLSSSDPSHLPPPPPPPPSVNHSASHNPQNSSFSTKSPDLPPHLIPLKSTNGGGTTSSTPQQALSSSSPAKEIPNKLTDLKDNTTRSS